MSLLSGKQAFTLTRQRSLTSFGTTTRHLPALPFDANPCLDYTMLRLREWLF